MLATETDRALALSIRGRSRKIVLASDHCGNEKKRSEETQTPRWL